MTCHSHGNQRPAGGARRTISRFGEVVVNNKRVIKAILDPAVDDGPLAASALILDGDEEATLIGTPADEIYDALMLKKLRGLYGSCMDEGRLDEVGAAPLLKITDTVRKLFDGSTMIVDAISGGECGLGKEQNGNLTAAIAFLHSRGIPVLFDMIAGEDAGNDPDAMTLWFTQSDFGLPSKEYFQEDSIVALYQSAIERLLEYLYENAPSASAFIPPPQGSVVVNDEAGRNPSTSPNSPLIAFEKRLAAASLPLDKLYLDPFGTYNPTPIANLTHALPQVAWGKYFASMTPRAYLGLVIVTYPAYPAKVAAILAETKGEVVAAYFVARAARALSPHLGHGTVPWKVTRELAEVLQGIKKGAVADRSEWCISKVESALGFALGRYFVNETFTGDLREKVTKVVTHIVGAFKKKLKDIECMDEESVNAAAEKVGWLCDGNFTLAENIADSGLIQSYRAWKAQHADSLQNGNDHLLPGLAFTREQLFFISFAQAWTQNIKPAAAVADVRGNPHSPKRYRVDGTVFNIPEFAEAFNCSATAKVRTPVYAYFG
ncbi:Metalloprotease [Punctularia strigosozonata HHB-11173 SS5]|uniref:Metalloprotease n=1 Tax=Punctularia strigosozonata (strain HHB-11173) TaxID=741275 RepID=UPI000441803C|nr:Metalloprotease [Punctularia strigosozonata HHB-11173 SS5]EIN07767.1 Metalloprotease [Punctularia strigosozonata HHB-11173 SS5]